MLSPNALILIAFILWCVKVLIVESLIRRLGESELDPNVRLLVEVREWLDSALIAAIIAFVTVTYVGRSFIIPSSSMEPTLKPGDVIIVDKISYRFRPIRRGEIVVFHPPIPNETRFFVKRVIGLPGDLIEIRDGKVFVNGRPLSEPYIKAKPEYVYGPCRVPPGQYFLLGDNRNNSYDSHAWDYPFVARKLIEGRVILRIFPPYRIRLFSRPHYNLSYLWTFLIQPVHLPSDIVT